MKKDKEISRAEKLAQKTDAFLGSNKKILVIILVVILLILVGVGIGTAIYSKNINSKYDELYNLEQSYSSLIVLDESSNEYNTAVSEFESEAEAFLQGNKIDSFLGARATLLLADVKFLEENWTESYELYLAVAEAHDDGRHGRPDRRGAGLR